MAPFFFCLLIVVVHGAILFDVMRWQRGLDPADMTPKQRMFYLAVKSPR